MSYIPENIKEEILQKANLENILNDVLPSPKKAGSSLHYDCPKCKGKEKLKYGKAKGIVKCFSCDIGTSKPVKFLKEYFGMTFKQALEEIAKIENITISETPIKAPGKKKDAIKKKSATRKQTIKDANHSFCSIKLEGSGLTTKDVTATIQQDAETKIQRPTFKQGTVDPKWEIVRGDDMIIFYYDLHGEQMYYYKKDKNGNATGNKLPFYRVRYQSPELHKDKYGNPVKYRSPWGSDSKIYIPQVIREKFQSGHKIKTLYIQEGELKAEKACKHNILSVGIMGIHNIASNNKLPAEFEILIKKCRIENVVFILDSDWKDLSSKIDSKRSADQRPRSFHRAVTNFRNHFYAFTGNDIHLKILFGHVKDNPENDKGIDDLLTNSLRGKEDSLAALCEKAVLQPKGDAQWLQFYDITTDGDYKLYSYWHLENKDSFVAHYMHVLKQLKEFKFGKVKWRIIDGEIELAQPLLDHERFWNETTSKDKTSLSFNYKRCYTFLQNRGFARYMIAPQKWIWIHIEGSIVREVDNYQIKDFVIDFVKQINREDVENLLYSGGNKYLGPDSMGNLEFRNLNLHLPGKGLQYMYFKNSFWKITQEGIQEIELKNIEGHVWRDKLRNFTPSTTEPLLSEIEKITLDHVKQNKDLAPFVGEYTVDFSKSGDQCEILQFILNTSRFSKKAIELYDIDEVFHTNRHFLSKITAIGYMLHRYRNANILKAVVGMDTKMGSVGESNGRSGKSLIGIILENLVPTVTIPGKKRDLLEDRFLFEEVDERTECVFIDDVRINFNIELLFPYISGKFTVEKKGLGKTTLPQHLTQKFYIATNHALRGEGSSFDDRQILLGFSDFYNESHKPVDDFGRLFFDEWDEHQYNLFYNFAAFCLHTYFKHGIIAAPSEELHQRRVRQEMGEGFLDWADEYFSKVDNVNQRITKKSLYSIDRSDPEYNLRGPGFKDMFPQEAKWVNIATFKKRLKQYCKFKDYQFNPSNQGKDIKTGGKEYIEIGVPDNVLDMLSKNALLELNRDNSDNVPWEKKK